MLKTLFTLLLMACALAAHAAPDPALVRQLADEDSSVKVAAIQKLTHTADPDTVRIFKAMAEDGLMLASDAAVIIDGDKAFDAATGKPVAMPENPESITVNNRIRGELANAMAALELFDADPAVRLASAQKLQSKVSPAMAPWTTTTGACSSDFNPAGSAAASSAIPRAKTANGIRLPAGRYRVAANAPTARPAMNIVMMTPT